MRNDSNHFVQNATKKEELHYSSILEKRKQRKPKPLLFRSDLKCCINAALNQSIETDVWMSLFFCICLYLILLRRISSSEIQSNRLLLLNFFFYQVFLFLILSELGNKV